MTTICPVCNGTRLPPALVGAERGTCDCKRPGRIKSYFFEGSTVLYEYDVEFNGVRANTRRLDLNEAAELLQQLRAEAGYP